MASTYRTYIERQRNQWIGRRVVYENKQYTVVDVDYNGALLIDKPAQFTDTTAVHMYEVSIVPQEYRIGWKEGGQFKYKTVKTHEEMLIEVESKTHISDKVSIKKVSTFKLNGEE